MNSRQRKPVYQIMYTPEEATLIKEKIPDIVKEAQIKSMQIMEPTIDESRAVIKVILDFIKEKQRIVYGGYALNELLIAKDPNDAIYTPYDINDIEFYSPTPVIDLMELCNTLYDAKFKHVQGRDAQHEETYSIFVNFELYCDITYVPTQLYYNIKKVNIDGINYVDPHFMLIDYLRMINDPMTSYFRLDKAFKRMYLLLKDYPIELYNNKLYPMKPNNIVANYIKLLDDEYLSSTGTMTILIAGIDAYNFYIQASGSVDKNSFMADVPYLEYISIDYKRDVVKIYNWLKTKVENPDLLEYKEFYPFFQFMGHRSLISYNSEPIVYIYYNNNMCIPYNKTNKQYQIVSFTYILMMFFILKFRAHIDKNKEMYFNYSTMISNLVSVRNEYLDREKLTVLDQSPFREFKINCIGTTISQARLSRLRMIKRREEGKSPAFSYVPNANHSEKVESTYFFKNSSGNVINNPRNLKIQTFDLDQIDNDMDSEPDDENEGQ
jgi:hypothetical protein